jgi:murein DD-endopeptidase MepM/ murein hydrolase activator NlpD
MYRLNAVATLSILGLVLLLRAEPPKPTLLTPMRTIDLNVGETQQVELSDGKKVSIKLVDLRETHDNFRHAVRRAEVTVEVAGEKVTLVSANYRLPLTIAGVRIDCPVTKGYVLNSAETVSGRNPWGLDKDARLRLWPAGAPLMNPGTFLYPVKQRWFASGTHMANEPCHVDGGEDPRVKQIYYHYGLDMGGAEGLVEVVAATDGLVVSSGKMILPGYDDSPVKTRYDVVYLLDSGGWYYRYSHLHTIDAEVTAGRKVKMGQRIGLLGKEGGSGGWSHLHFDISGRQPSGKWGIIEGYAFLWESYLREQRPKLWPWPARIRSPPSVRRWSSTVADRGQPPGKSRPISGLSLTAKVRPAPPWSMPTRSRASTAKC